MDGYRCGAALDLGGSNFERLVFHAPALPGVVYPTPSGTPSARPTNVYALSFCTNATSAGRMTLATGEDYTCVVSSAGEVRCWGDNRYITERDFDWTPLVPMPEAVAMGGQVSITVGERHVCSLSAAGGVGCWGSDYYNSIEVPTATAVGGQVTISAGFGHTCALSAAGAVTCWGLKRSRTDERARSRRSGGPSRRGGRGRSYMRLVSGRCSCVLGQEH